MMPCSRLFSQEPTKPEQNHEGSRSNPYPSAFAAMSMDRIVKHSPSGNVHWQFVQRSVGEAEHVKNPVHRSVDVDRIAPRRGSPLTLPQPGALGGVRFVVGTREGEGRSPPADAPKSDASCKVVSPGGEPVRLTNQDCWCSNPVSLPKDSDRHAATALPAMVAIGVLRSSCPTQIRIPP